jgi:ribosomal protein L1
VWEESSSREQDYEISIEVPITARATKMITITAASQEEALEKAKKDAADYIDSDDIDNYNINWDWDNAEVESVLT